MKPLTLTFAIAAAGVAIQQGWIGKAGEGLAQGSLGPEAELAVEIRCEGRDQSLIVDCRNDLAEHYLAGTLDPQATLRAHCTRFVNTWADSIPEPPQLCVELYGGWHNS